MKPSPIGRGDFVADRWRERFEACRLADFERLWALDLPALDDVNTTRGGISRVSLLALGPPGRDEYPRLIVKRQQNHLSRTWRHPLTGIPTLEKEYVNLRRFRRFGLPTAVPVLFARRRDDCGIRAILVTEYLEANHAFDTVLEEWARGASPDGGDREVILHAVANLLARIIGPAGGTTASIPNTSL